MLLEARRCDGRVVDLVYRDVNTATCSYFGLSRADLLGHRIIDDGLVDYYLRCAENGDAVILDDCPRQRETGLYYYDVRAAQIRPGLISLTWRDVTERFTLARRVAVSEERLRLLADNIGDVVVRLTDDGYITWVSDSVEQALGAPADYWVNRRFTEFGLPGRRTDGRQRWAQVAAGKSYTGRRQVRGHGGAVHWIHLHAEPFHDADGTRDGIVASFRVIDDEVAVEDRAREEIAQRDEHNRSLAQYLKAQTTRLMAELNSAACYVASILPEDLHGRVAATSRYLPSEELGGDTYDFRWVDDDHLMVYLVDVSGHGVGPALLSVSVHNLLRSGSFGRETLLRPGAVLTELNRLFQMDRQGGNYFTIWFGVYEASTRTLRYASAGRGGRAGAAVHGLATGRHARRHGVRDGHPYRAPGLRNSGLQRRGVGVGVARGRAALPRGVRPCVRVLGPDSGFDAEHHDRETAGRIGAGGPHRRQYVRSAEHPLAIPGRPRSRICAARRNPPSVPARRFATKVVVVAADRVPAKPVVRARRDSRS